MFTGNNLNALAPSQRKSTSPRSAKLAVCPRCPLDITRFAQPLEEMSAVTHNRVCMIRQELDYGYKFRHSTRFPRNQFLVALKALILAHKETYARTGKVQGPGSQTHYSDGETIKPFLSHPFPEDFKFRFPYLDVAGEVPMPCNAFSKPTYLDDLTAFLNVIHLAYHVCHAQTHLVDALTKKYPIEYIRDQPSTDWQQVDDLNFWSMAIGLSIALKKHKENVAAAAERGEDIQLLILDIYTSFADGVQVDVDNQLENSYWETNGLIRDWENVCGVKYDPRALNMLATASEWQSWCLEKKDHCCIQ